SLAVPGQFADFESLKSRGRFPVEKDPQIEAAEYDLLGVAAGVAVGDVPGLAQVTGGFGFGALESQIGIARGPCRKDEMDAQGILVGGEKGFVVPLIGKGILPRRGEVGAVRKYARAFPQRQIGRASCRERVEDRGVALRVRRTSGCWR